jgi:CheY-like chemotaxis protein
MTRTILVVEDTDVGRDALEAALARLPGFTVHAVATAEEALTCLAAEDVCALVTDLNLGEMDGFDLIAWVRSHPQRSLLPVVVISGSSDEQAQARAAGIGANAYFTKPYSPAAVCSKLEQLIDVY